MIHEFSRISLASRLKPSFIASSLGNEYAARTYGFGPDTVEKQVPGTNKTEKQVYFRIMRGF